MRKPSGSRLRNQFSLFFIFVLFSAFIWLLIKLSHNFTSTVTYRAVYENIPMGQILISASDTNITVGLDASGFDLVSYHLFKKRPEVKVDLSGLMIRNVGNTNKGVLPTAGLLRKMASQIGSHNELLFISPDSLRFVFMSEHSKKVPVIPVLQYRLRPQHMLYDSLKITPDSVWVFGPETIIDTIKSVRTLAANLPDLHEDKQIMLRLEKPQGLPLEYSENQTEILLRVEKFTEKAFSLPINIICHETGYSLRVFPETVSVNCLVALKDYKRVDPAMFEASVYCDPTEIHFLSKLRVNITKHPSFVQIIRIDPERVEYILVSSSQ